MNECHCNNELTDKEKNDILDRFYEQIKKI